MMKPDGVDVMKMREDQLLEYLGKADWVIALPEGLPNISITASWRRTLQAYSGKQFARWVMEGVDRIFTQENDPPWDHSGSLREVKTDPLLLLVRHESLYAWAENEYTGHSEATFVSGMGLSWVTYAEDIRDYFEEQLYTRFSVHCMNFWKFEVVEDVYADERWDVSDIPMIILLLASALLEDTLQVSTADAWKQFEASIHAENDAKRKEAEQYRRMYEQVREFWEAHFPDLMRLRVEMPMFRAMGLEQRIADVLADTDPDIVRMMAQVRIPGHYSNTVYACIQDIVRRANRE